MNIPGKAKRENTCDAIVVGSGISGGWAEELTQKGLKVLLPERGRLVEHLGFGAEFKEFVSRPGAWSIGRTILRVALWLMAVLFLLNTVGNVFSNDRLEQMLFTPVTLLLAVQPAAGAE